jgi:hypothetical protein
LNYSVSVKAERSVAQPVRAKWHAGLQTFKGLFVTRPSIAAANTFGKFQFTWVFGKVPEAVRQHLVAFCLRENAIANAAEAWRRSFETACVLHDTENGAIAGACTIAIGLDEQGVS